MSIRFEHIRCPLHRYTFSVKPIRAWVERTCAGRVLNLFAGKTKLAVDEYRNDLDPDMPAHSHLDALDFLRGYPSEKFGTILLDPPYAYRKSMELYKGILCSPFRQLKDEAVKHLAPGGLVVTFGYHSIVMGKSRGFSLEQLAIFSHGGAIHDTLASVERFTPPYPALFPPPARFPPKKGRVEIRQAAIINSKGYEKRTYHEQQHLYH